MKRLALIAAVGVGAIALGLGAIFASSSLRWRAELVAMKVTGRLPPLEWGEVRE